MSIVKAHLGRSRAEAAPYGRLRGECKRVLLGTRERTVARVWCVPSMKRRQHVTTSTIKAPSVAPRSAHSSGDIDSPPGCLPRSTDAVTVIVTALSRFCDVEISFEAARRR